MLVAAAAAQWGVDAASLTTDKGIISHAASGRTLPYGAVADRAAQLPPPANVALKSPDQFRLIGTPARRIDTPDKVTGKTVYGIDVMVPGLSSPL